MADLELRGIQKVYGGGFTAIPQLDLDIADGELVVLVGPSGCGKSTLLRMIAGLESITAGEIRIDGAVVNTVEPAERDIAMVFQNYALYPHMSVRQNLEYGLKNRKTPRDEIARRVDEAARILEIEPLLDRKPRQLSGGQRQRVAMGRAIVRHPKVFLFDEPLSNLDAKLRGQMRVEIRRLQRRLGTTSVYVTHDQLEAMTLADKLVVMNKGQIEQVGKPMELYSRPASTFVANFIGSPPMNLIPRAELDKAVGGRLEAILDKRAGIVGIRPDSLLLERRAESDLVLDGVAELVEPVGGECHFYVSIEGVQQTLTAVTPMRDDLQDGTAMKLYLPLDHLHLFDAQTSLRID
ncbi:sn-glycerol-3-phosphate ABC transporter ATP-binding protein UgpC [Devosia honganensis]|uniref:Sn-glycerol-3-phosphate ABC transporter ATP-binding protein UgpC n=1 Tax=Devosia honganensis TaxID=1610527 RepID=A0ABV7WXB5_9HYPH